MSVVGWLAWQNGLLSGCLGTVAFLPLDWSHLQPVLWVSIDRASDD